MNATRRRTRASALPEATLSELDGVRFLHLDSIWVQGAMRIARPNAIELQYVQRMMAWLLWLPPDALAGAHAVLLGLGAGAITRFCVRVLGMRSTAVEINPAVIRACRLWFHLPPDDARLAVLEVDAGRWVADPANAGCAQALCIDLYDHEAAAPVLDDEDFYAACRRVLVPGGVMSVNLFGRDASFAASAGRIAAAFGAGHVWRVQPTREGNTVVVAGRDAVLPAGDELRVRAADIETRFGLPARKWPKMITPWPAGGTLPASVYR